MKSDVCARTMHLSTTDFLTRKFHPVYFFRRRLIQPRQRPFNYSFASFRLSRRGEPRITRDDSRYDHDRRAESHRKVNRESIRRSD